MLETNTIARIYTATTDSLRVGDVAALAPNLVMVAPVRPPAKSAGGLFLPGAGDDDDSRKVIGTAAILYRVLAVGPTRDVAGSEEWMIPAVGDVLSVRTSMLDPMHPELEPLVIHRRHVLAVLGTKE